MHPFWIVYIVCAVICLSVCIASIFSERISEAFGIDSIGIFFAALFASAIPVVNIVTTLSVLFFIADHYKPKHWS